MSRSHHIQETRGESERAVSAWLDLVEPGRAGREVLRRIGGRSPDQIVEARRIASLRRMSGAAALVLGVLFAFGADRGRDLSVLRSTSMSALRSTSMTAVVAIDPVEVEQLALPHDLIGDIFNVEVPE